MKLFLQVKRAGYIDAGEWHKPVYQIAYEDKYMRCIPLKCSGENKPTGQDLLDAVRDHGSKALKSMTESEVFAALVV